MSRQSESCASNNPLTSVTSRKTENGINNVTSQAALSNSASKDYLSFIKACFNAYPAASSYYQQLINYIAIGPINEFSPLQTPKIYLLGRNKGKRGEQRPDGSKSSSSQNTERHSSTPLQCVQPKPGQLIQAQSQPHITVLEGFLAPESINLLGATYKLRPELFISHLELSDSRATFLGQRHYESPNLPSNRDNIIHVRLFSMLRITGRPASRERHLLKQRAEIESRRGRYERRLFHHRQYGASHFRAIHIHNEEMLTVEQMVTLSVSGDRKSWHGLFILDSGRPCGNIDLPWSEFVGESSGTTNFIPVVPYNLPVTIDGGNNELKEVGIQNHPYHPFGDILRNDLAGEDLLQEDPFYIASRLYCHASRERAQLLNFIESDIAECSRVDIEHLSSSLGQLRFNLQLVRRVERYCKEDLIGIDRHDSFAMPQSSALGDIEKLRKLLQKDYAYLIEQCTNLALQCETSSQVLVSMAQLMEAQKGIRQSRQLAGLTFLAFIFVPLSYTSSIFGMNVTGIRDGVEIWVWVVLSALSIIVALGSFYFFRWIKGV